MKIQRVINKYGLDGLEEELLDRKMGSTYEQHSLRELEEFFNTKIIEVALQNAGNPPLEGEAENFYHLLTAEEVSEGMRLQAIDRLNQTGVDVESLEEDFISYQSINRFLKPDLPESKSEEQSVEDLASQVYKLQSRTSTVTASILDQIAQKDSVKLGEVEVLVDITVTCTDCGLTKNFREILTTGCCCE